MNKRKKEPIYIKLLKINCILPYFKICSIGAIIVNWTRRGPIETKSDVLIHLYCWTAISLFFIIIIRILGIIFIKITNKQYPLPKKSKIYFIIFNFFYSGILLSNYLQYKKWTYKEYIEERRNKAKINSETNNNKIDNTSLINIDNKEINLTYYKYLQEKYKNVTVIMANENIEKYRVGIKLNKEDFFKNYLIVQINLKYSSFWWQYLHINMQTWHCFCIFSLTDIKHMPRWSFRLRMSTNNSYYKFFRTITGMTHWISKNFPQFNNTND